MPQPLWTPSAERVERANLSRFLKFVAAETGDSDLIDYPSLHAFSVDEPERFWPLVWDFCGIKASGEREPVLVDGDRMPGARWFPNMRLNFAENLLRFKDDRMAILFRGENGASEHITYAQLRHRVAALAAALQAQGVSVGDRVAGFMPNHPDAVVAMLATASLGAIWSSCSPDFGINGVVDRFGQIQPKVLFTAASYQYGGKRLDCLEKIRGVLGQIDTSTISWRPLPQPNCISCPRPSTTRSTSCTARAPRACPSASCTASVAPCSSTSRSTCCIPM